MPSVQRFRLESAVARAHRALWEAHLLADQTGEDQLSTELSSFALYLSEIQCDLLSPSKTMRVSQRVRAYPSEILDMFGG
jgi:hypothetical protein